MRLLTVRRLALAVLAPTLLMFAAIPGCSNESEGQRCGDDPADPSAPGTVNDDDCSSPLVCVAANLLINNQANRCCDPNPSIVNDARCQRASGSSAATGGTGGSSAAGSSAAGSSAAGSSVGGTAGTAGAASAGTAGTATDVAMAGAGGA